MTKLFPTISTWQLVKPFSVNEVKKERLIREILVLKSEIKNLETEDLTLVGPRSKDTFGDKKEVTKYDALYKSLDISESLAGKHEFEKSWGYLLNAEQSAINAMGMKQIRTRAGLLLIEAAKLNGWRKEQIFYLLKDLDNENALPKDQLLKAIAIRNDFYLARSHKINLHKVNVNILVLVMTLLVASIFFLSFKWDLTKLDFTSGANFPRVLIISAIFGALGAGFSYAKTLFSYNPESSKIPDQLLSMAVTSFRFIIGATAAVIILLFWGSGVLSKQFSDIILSSSYTYLIFSFVAGFSERYLIKMLGIVSKEKE